MSLTRKLLLLLFAVGIITVIVLTWGSLGSAALVFCLILMGASLLYQKFLTNRDNNDFDMEY